MMLRRIQDTVTFLQTHTSSKILLLGLPPRGVWNPETKVYEFPSIFTAPTTALTHILRRLAAGREMVSYLDCGDQLLTSDGKVWL
jgi:hypothetical protein